MRSSLLVNLPYGRGRIRRAFPLPLEVYTGIRYGTIRYDKLKARTWLPG